MRLSRSIDIQAPREAVWGVVTDIERAESTISGISKVEVLEPARGPSIVGLKWRETRPWMGKEATEVMWITEAVQPDHYDTRAESHGSVYETRLLLEEIPEGTRLTMAFQSQPVTAGAKVLWALTGWMAKGALRKTIDQDLADIKAAVEKTS